MSARRARAFTLIELLVVIAIVSILASLTFGVVGKIRTKVQVAVAQDQLAQISAALAMYHADMRRYPRHAPRSAPDCLADDAAALYTATRNRPAAGGGLDGPYLRGWKAEDVGLIATTELAPDRMGSQADPGVERVTGAQVGRLATTPFQAAHGSDAAQALVLLDPWGNPYHYREWASVPRKIKNALVAQPVARTCDGSWTLDGAAVASNVTDAPHGLETYDVWSAGPNGVNEYGAKGSDDVRSW